MSKPTKQEAARRIAEQVKNSSPTEQLKRELIRFCCKEESLARKNQRRATAANNRAGKNYWMGYAWAMEEMCNKVKVLFP